MPAVSQAQRGYLAAHFGTDWMKRHHFDNKGRLPMHVGGKKLSPLAAAAARKPRR